MDRKIGPEPGFPENGPRRGSTLAWNERLRADMAARETRMLLAIAGMLGLAVAVLGFVLS